MTSINASVSIISQLKIQHIRAPSALPCSHPSPTSTSEFWVKHSLVCVCMCVCVCVCVCVFKMVLPCMYVSL